jgi:hypothetical protein
VQGKIVAGQSASSWQFLRTRQAPGKVLHSPVLSANFIAKSSSAITRSAIPGSVKDERMASDSIEGFARILDDRHAFDSPWMIPT